MLVFTVRFTSPRAAVLTAAFATAFCGCRANRAPELVPVGAQTASVGTSTELELDAQDLDGDALTFGFECSTLDFGKRARIISAGVRAFFYWTPIAGDVGKHTIDFTVTDGQTTDREPVLFTVRSAAGPETRPQFLEPAADGTTLTYPKDPCITVHVAVDDQDTLNINIFQKPEIPGSKLERRGGREAVFTWCPTKAQADQGVHVLWLWADDGDNEPVSKDFTIVIRTELPQNCPGQPPSIVHTPSAEKVTADPIVLSATITDDKGLKGAPVLYYSKSEPSDPKNVDVSTMTQATMKKALGSGDVYEAVLPNPTAGLQGGSSQPIYYVFVAEDDDDATGNCDHRTQLPATGTFQLVVKRPDTAKSCGTTPDCGGNNLVCSNKLCVSDGCVPKDLNADGYFHEQGTCPALHFCAFAGPSNLKSHCLPKCQSDADCKVAGTTCKVIDTVPGKGCAKTGPSPVGGVCQDFTDCQGKNMCLGWPGGYCALSDCDSTGSFSGPCPAGTACIPLPDDRPLTGQQWLCLKTCNSATDCRSDSGYGCQTVQDDVKKTVKVCKQ